MGCWLGGCWEIRHPTSGAFERLIAEKRVDPARVLMGLPHPSPNNGKRINYFLEKKLRVDLSDKKNPDILDKAKIELFNQVKVLSK